MTLVIVTNNAIVQTKSTHPILPVSGNSSDVLKKVRDLVHTGSRLVSYPLGASIKMLHSPVTSVLIEQQDGAIDPESLEIIEESILKLDRVLGERKPDERNRSDYEVVDWNRLQAALTETKKF